jgi:hypothetical protein
MIFLVEALSKTLLLRYSSHSAKHVQAGERAPGYQAITWSAAEGVTPRNRSGKVRKQLETVVVP